jgi:phosphate transport system substrate-binding protein|tara:strand:- start:5170 stop:5973 length:804 start_codon:yes stop_codon:yes gene_type:complete
MKLHSFLLLGLVSFLGAQTKIVIKGSDTLGAKMIPKLAEAYQNKNASSKFEIAAEGSSTGIAAIIDGTADIGMSSRELKGKEKASAGANGVFLYQTVIATDAVAIIVNEKNPLDSLSSKQVERIFTGDISDWSSVGGSSGKISVYTRNTSSGTYSFFQKVALSSRDYGSNTQKLAGNEQIATEVAKNPQGVGYVGLAYLKAKGIKAVKLNGVYPSNESVNANQYKLSRNLNCFTNGKPKGNAKSFLDFALTTEGQIIVESTGFVRVK